MSASQNLIPARQALRDTTASVHRDVEDGFSPLDLTARGPYRQFLAVHALVIPAAEQALEAGGIARLLPDWPQRARRQMLRDDLAILGWDGPERLPELRLSGTAALLGAAYVLEGSRLGAQMILHTIAQSPDAKVQEATHFLRHGEGLRLWPTFCPVLDREVTGDVSISEAGNAARRVFSHFRQAQHELLGDQALATGS
jgi:heme oxygenase